MLVAASSAFGSQSVVLTASCAPLPTFFNLQRLRSGAEPGNVFYTQNEPEPVEVTMMRSRGDFKMGFSDALKAQVIELPYEVGVWLV